MKFKQLILGVTSVSAVLFSGCQFTPEYGFALDSDHVVYRNDVAKKEALKREEFRLQVASVVDRRTGEERTAPAVDYETIYRYDPNRFLQGLEPFVKSNMASDLRGISDGNIPLTVDLEIERFKLWISKGTFMAGAYGNYNVDLAIHMIVRDEESEVLLSETVEYNDYMKRSPFKGHHPTLDMDRKAISNMLNEGLDEISKDMGWLIHRAFNDQRKYYRPETFERKFETDSEDLNAIPAS